MNWLKIIIDFLAGAMGMPPSPPAPTPDPDPPPTIPPDNVIEELLESHNAERNKKGLQPLRLNEKLRYAAQQHAQWMARNRKMNHTGENGSRPGDRARDAGYRWQRVGENIAMGYATVSAVMNGWMNSSGHRGNILGNYKEVGLGYAKSDRTYWCALFGTATSDPTVAYFIDRVDAPGGIIGDETITL